MVRHVDPNGKVVSTERLALLTSGGDHVYVSQTSEAPAIAFEPVDPSATQRDIELPEGSLAWAWANYENDFPQEVHFVSNGDSLETQLSASGEDGGWLMGWRFERVGACGEEPEPEPKSR
ncbi:hypothetical protein DB30_06032 [Enhygromyxa salina]|uniref:Uncharacterized protein n=1 Tax=Enhygromyxa salina TaxID=215803 RepID=A0A0C1ZBM3_9BACT|nr:hypothetical protein DB30_06032 [Enhygromyxa salina]